MISLMLLSASIFASDLKVGLSANIGMSQPAQSGLDAGLAYGVGAKINFDLGSVSLQPELLFAQRMLSTSSSVLGITIESTSTLSFIMLPILVSYPVTNEISVLVGPSLNSALSGSSETDGNSTDIEDLNAVGFSVIGGVSYALNENINVGVRYDHMISENSTADGASDSQIGAIALNLGYNF